MSDSTTPPIQANYLYFKASGKYYTSALGECIPKEKWPDSITRKDLEEINGVEGKLPGLNTLGTDFFIIVDDPESWPHLLYPIELEARSKVMETAFAAGIVK